MTATSEKNIVALVPLRGGSKGIPLKNIRSIGGKPLCAWVLEAATHAAPIAATYVSTDSPEIEAVVRALNLGVRIIHRPAAFATDEASTESVMLHFMDQVPFDRLVTIQATSPLLKAKDIEEAIGQFELQRLDSMLTAVRVRRFFWRDDATPINYDPLQRPRRQDFRGILMENGAFYVTSRHLLERTRCRLGGRIGVFEMAEHSAVEIDDPADWDVVSQLLAERSKAVKS